MTIYVPNGVASGAGMLNSFYDLLSNAGKTNVSAGMPATISVGQNYGKITGYKNPPPPPPLPADRITWAATPQAPVPVVAQVVQTYIPGVTGATGNLNTIFTSGYAQTYIGFTGSGFVAWEQSSGKIATSSDGVTWSVSAVVPSDWGGTTNNFFAWTGSKIIMIPYTSNSSTWPGSITSKILSSSDGITWTQLASDVRSPYTSSPSFQSVASNGAGIVVVSRWLDSGGWAFYVSADHGATWSNQTPAICSASPYYIATVTWTGTAFIAVTSTGVCASSTDGVTWSSSSAPAPLATAGGGMTVLLNGSNLYTSMDNGVTWDGPHTIPFSGSVATNGSIVVIVKSASGGIHQDTFAYSADRGATWTTATLPAYGYYWNAIWTGSAFLAVSPFATDNAVALISANGTAWANGTPGVPAVSITQADIDAFNALHAGDGVTAYLATSTLAPGLALPVTVPVAEPDPANVAMGALPTFSIESIMAESPDTAYTVFHDGTGRFFDCKTFAWTDVETDRCHLKPSDLGRYVYYPQWFLVTVEGIAAWAAFLSPYRVVLSETFTTAGAGGPKAQLWALSYFDQINGVTCGAPVALYHAGMPFDFGGGKYWLAPKYVTQWSPGEFVLPLFSAAVSYPHEWIPQWQAVMPTQGQAAASASTGTLSSYVNGALEPVTTTTPAGPTDTTTTSYVVSARRNFLVGGSFVEVAAAPLPVATGGSMSELTAPPLSFSAGGSLTERTSSVTLPIPNIAAGGALEHTGVPFTLGG